MRTGSILLCALAAACGPSYAERDQPLNEVAKVSGNTMAPVVTAEEQAAAVAAQAKLDEENERYRKIEEVRQRDPALNWVNIGITTGKFSESIGSSVHRTYQECIDRSAMEDNECFPIAALPDSYWNASPGSSPDRAETGTGSVSEASRAG